MSTNTELAMLSTRDNRFVLTVPDIYLDAILDVEIALFNGLPSLWHCWDAITRVELDPSPADTLFVNHHIFNTNHTLNVAIATFHI